MYGLGPTRGIAVQLPGKNGIYHGYIHPVFLMLNRDRSNIAWRCACMCGTSLGVFSTGRISLTLIGCSACVGGSVDCSEWLHSVCAVDFSPEGVWIGYIRPGLWDESLIDAAPVTGSLVSSALFDCLDVYCTDDVPKSSISIPELSTLSQKWPPAVISHMGWRQQELEGMRVAAKQRFRQSRPSSYCGIWIKCDVYRHVARFHLDLAQLWRCPVSWCTIWKGTPQELPIPT